MVNRIIYRFYRLLTFLVKSKTFRYIWVNPKEEMYPAPLIAAYFVDMAVKEGNPITQMKLQKMLYFAQGYHLTRYGTPILQEAIQAWKFGPVVPTIYQQYKSYGSGYIMSNDNVKDTSLLPPNYLIDGLPDDLKDTINYTWRATKDKTAESLSAWTHINNSPWDKTYDKDKFGAEIDNTIIKEYFDEFLTTKN